MARKKIRTEPRASTQKKSEVAPERLRWRCTPKMLGIKTTQEAEPAKEIIGQDRALRALRVGLEMEQHGYNIFVTGGSGTGRTTTIRRLLREFEGRPCKLTDKCYVHNFRDPDAPKLITLPTGQGVAFKKDMENLVQELLKAIPGI